MARTRPRPVPPPEDTLVLVLRNPSQVIDRQQALDPIEIPVTRNKQRIDQDHGLPRFRGLRPSIFARAILETERAAG